MIPSLLVWIEWQVLRFARHPLPALAAETFAIAGALYVLAESDAVRWLLPRHLLRKLDLTAGLLDPLNSNASCTIFSVPITSTQS
jgi:hypothetical protein